MSLSSAIHLNCIGVTPYAEKYTLHADRSSDAARLDGSGESSSSSLNSGVRTATLDFLVVVMYFTGLTVVAAGSGAVAVDGRVFSITSVAFPRLEETAVSVGFISAAIATVGCGFARTAAGCAAFEPMRIGADGALVVVVELRAGELGGGAGIGAWVGPGTCGGTGLFCSAGVTSGTGAGAAGGTAFRGGRGAPCEGAAGCGGAGTASATRIAFIAGAGATRSLEIICAT